MYDIVIDMARRRNLATPTPEALAGTRSRSLHMVSFRLSDPEHDALLSLAHRAGIGHCALARRIVEHYINEHAPERGRGRK